MGKPWQNAILRQTKTIKNSTSIKFISTKIDTATIIETFCLESFFTLKDNFQATFTPKTSKTSTKNPKTLHTITSFLNIPSINDEELLTSFLNQYATIQRPPRYLTNTHGGIEYSTRSRIYQPQDSDGFYSKGNSNI